MLVGVLVGLLMGAGLLLRKFAKIVRKFGETKRSAGLRNRL